jgi:hypothetical protein
VTLITLTINSTPSYLVTGSGGQTIKMPVATTLPNGTLYTFNNNQSSGAILVNNNSNTLIKSVPSGGNMILELIDNSTAAGSWDVHFQSPSNVSWSTNTFDYPGSITSATWNGVSIADNRISSAATWNAKEDSANKVTTFTGNETSTTKFPVVKAILDYFSATNIKSILGITTLSGSNTGDQDLTGLVVKNTAITGATKTKITYDAKGLVTAGTDATTADIADSTNKRYQTDNQNSFNDATSSIQTQLNAKQPQLNGTGFVKASGTTISYDNTKYNPIIVSDFFNFVFTGTTANTILISYLIPANTFAINDIFNLTASVLKNTTVGNFTLSFFINTTNSLTGASRISTTSYITTTQFGVMSRSLACSSSGLIGYSQSTAAFSDQAATIQAFSTTAYTYSSAYYLIVTGQLSISTDAINLGFVRLSK